MTVIANIIAGDMVGRLAGCCGAIVATAAAAQHGGMINPGNRVETARVMAILATVAGAHMNRGLARRRSAIVATGTTGSDTGVIKDGTGKASSTMAVIAGIAALDMTTGLPKGLGSVVATGTASQDRRMIHAGNC